MSGALNSVFGGGNIFGSLLSIASIAFPPMAIATSMSNLFTQAFQTAMKLAVNNLVQDFGMPKFLGDIINNLVQNVAGQNQRPTESAVDEFVSERAGTFAQQWAEDFARSTVQNTVERLNRASSGSSKKSAGSWLEAIALAMADAMSSKSAQMIDLSKEIADLSKAGQGIDKGDTKALKKNSEDINAANARMSASGKEFEMLTNTMKNVVDSLGNALAQAARKS